MDFQVTCGRERWSYMSVQVGPIAGHFCLMHCAIVLAARSSARSHLSLMFPCFDPGTSQGGGAPAGTSHYCPIQPALGSLLSPQLFFRSQTQKIPSASPARSFRTCDPKRFQEVLCGCSNVVTAVSTGWVNNLSPACEHTAATSTYFPFFLWNAIFIHLSHWTVSSSIMIVLLEVDLRCTWPQEGCGDLLWELVVKVSSHVPLASGWQERPLPFGAALSLTPLPDKLNQPLWCLGLTMFASSLCASRISASLRRTRSVPPLCQHCIAAKEDLLQAQVLWVTQMASLLWTVPEVQILGTVKGILRGPDQEAQSCLGHLPT